MTVTVWKVFVEMKNHPKFICVKYDDYKDVMMMITNKVTEVK